MRYLLLLLCWSSALSAQDDHYFRLTYANDYFGATDYYFTQGIRLEYGSERDGWLLAQEGYTPTSIRDDRIRYGDRPYAGALYVGYRRAIPTGTNWSFSHQLIAGVMGPWSLAAAEQRYIHDRTGNVAPRGWKYQIANDLLLNYRVNARRTLLDFRYLRLDGLASARAGTYHSRLQLGPDLRIGVLPVTDAAGKRRRFELALHLRPAAHLNLYDATLQGGLLNRDSPYTLTTDEVRRLVGSVDVGIAVGRRKWGVSFTRTYLSPEFSGGRPHDWGTIQLRIGGGVAPTYGSW
ncbi:lipid A deacylase LpxR family protein [Lewinella sp. IMCC34183]|uniref:lipid A deacylase LpxR family protein n=1 Tax=Lewinella sp. IMCC34183 TaxID=2248762 RepID=UPI00130062AD|nr:lipid A deacylase LpxR family protein [Lewinella sp. IMCC34183]